MLKQGTFPDCVFFEYSAEIRKGQEVSLDGKKEQGTRKKTGFRRWKVNIFWRKEVNGNRMLLCDLSVY